MATSLTAARPLQEAVHRDPGATRGIPDRLFTFAFRGLVYPQIWEDPVVDMQALALTPDSRLLTIASGGCNVLSYLTADPKAIVAVDLSPAHVALTRLKLAAIRHLPSHGAFHRFFAEADHETNLPAYHRFLRNKLDGETRAYWDSRDLLHRPRISRFTRGFYRHGLLGIFIGAAHLAARLYGVDPRNMLLAASLDEQRRYFDASLSPLFDKRLIRWAISKRMSLFGLGIPPAQYELLAGGATMTDVLRGRLEKLACGFPLSENYFAWQAFGRRYAPGAAAPLPPYLRRENFDAIRSRSERVSVLNRPITAYLESEASERFDGYVLLDAQDWMTDAQLNALWSAITRTARPGARVIFRTAARPTLLPGRVQDSVLSRWTYQADASRDFAARDRSSIYGGFHLYVLRG